LSDAASFVTGSYQLVDRGCVAPWPGKQEVSEMMTSTSQRMGQPKVKMPVTADFQAHPMIYVVRFCGPHPSSIGAAVGQAIAVLDNFLNRLGAPPPSTLFVVYRNQIEGAVTVQAGYPVSQEAAAAVTGEIFAGYTPSGQMVELTGEKTLDHILAVGRSLPESSASYTWQILNEGDFRPWTGKLPEGLFVPAQFWPHIQRHAAVPGGGN
jgi:hypothetical protein